MDNILLTILVALFGGFGATALWELALKPMRDRRSLAEILSAEISLNMQMLAAAKVLASPRKIPPDFRLSTLVYTTTLARVGELPNNLVGEVVFLYRYFEELNEHPKTYVRFVDELRAATGQPHAPAIEREITSCVDVFNSYVEKAIARVNIVQPLLLKVAFPFWSVRRWARKRSETLSLENVAAQITDAFREREMRRRRLEANASEGKGSR